MKRIFASLLLLLSSAPVMAAGPWTKAQVGQQVGFTVLLVGDWLQTRAETDLPCQQRLYREKNKILGDCPSTENVDEYFAGAWAGHTAIAHILPNKKIVSWSRVTWRGAWQGVWIAREAYAVGNNYRIGVRFDF